MDKTHTLDRLRALIGRGFSYQGRSYILVDVLAEEEFVVLDHRGRGATTIQADQFGRPLRRAGGVRVMPVFSRRTGGISAELRELLACLDRA